MSVHFLALLQKVRAKGEISVAQLAEEAGASRNDPEFVKAVNIVKRQADVYAVLYIDKDGRTGTLLGVKKESRSGNAR